MMSGKEPLPRRNPLLTMAKYMSDAGSDGYSGLTMLYHHTTTQLIIQWTGTHISQSEKVEFEQSLLKLLKGCEGESNEDLEHLEYEEQETGMDMADDHATSEMDSSYTEHTDADYVVKQEPEEIICTNSSDEPTIPYSSVPLEFSTSDSATAADEPTIPHSSAPLEFSVSDSATSTTDVVNQQLVMTSKSRKKGQGARDVINDHLVASSTATKPDKGEGKKADGNGLDIGQTNFVPVCTSLMATGATQGRDTPTSTAAPNSCWYFQCQRCDFTSHKKIELDRHVHWSHSGTKPYSCSLCPFTCSYSHVLKRHMLTHTGEKPHQCKFCLKRFARSDSAAKHMETHNVRREKQTNGVNCHTPPIRATHGKATPKSFKMSRLLPIAPGHPQSKSTIPLPAPLFNLNSDVTSSSQRFRAEAQSSMNRRMLSPPPLIDNRPVFPQAFSSVEVESNANSNDNQ